MAIHELTTNAAKYGALSSPQGRVEVTWDVTNLDERRMLHLRWAEHGGPPVAKPNRKGFGSTLLERVLTAQCSAEIRFDFEPEGLRFRMDVPLVRDRLVPKY
jgi:two-component sensor histidine kinase